MRRRRYLPAFRRRRFAPYVSDSIVNVLGSWLKWASQVSINCVSINRSIWTSASTGSAARYDNQDIFLHRNDDDDNDDNVTVMLQFFAPRPAVHTIEVTPTNYLKKNTALSAADKLFFSERVINVWNYLPYDIVCLV